MQKTSCGFAAPIARAIGATRAAFQREREWIEVPIDDRIG